MQYVVFFVAAVGVLAGAHGTVALRNPFYSVLALVGHLVSLAVLFLLLRAEFVAMAQVVVYAGAVMVLYVFVVSYVGGADHMLAGPATGRMKVASGFFGLLLFVELSIAILGSGLGALDSEGAALGAGFGSPGQIGELLLTKFLVAFELASFLLLIAAVGAVTLARRRGGLHSGEEDRVSAADLARPPVGTGTMAEAVGNLHTPATTIRQGLGDGDTPVREDATVGTRSER
jgi:NADH:ubiquinone oxidoreductase subunit 6 (subunit J)